MSNVRNIQISFGGGEVSPEMYGRIDDAKYRQGLALCRNFVVKPQGPVENRAGLGYVNTAKIITKKTCLISFTYSTTQTMVIEMGDKYFRFHTLGKTLLDSGGAPYEVETPYAEEDLFDIHYVQSADILTLVHPNYAPRELRRLGATNWELKEITLAPDIAAPQGVSAVCAGYTSIKYSYDYVITSVSTDNVSESQASAVAHTQGNLYETGCTATISWNPVAGASRYNVYKLQGGIYGYIGNTTGTSIVDDNIAPDLSITPPIYDNVFSVAGEIVSVPVIQGGVLYGDIHDVITNVTVNSSACHSYSITGVSIADPTGTGAVLDCITQEIRDWEGILLGYGIDSISVVSGGKDYSNPQIVVHVVGGNDSIRFGIDSFSISKTTTEVSLKVTDSGGGYGAVLRPNIVNEAIVSVTVVNHGSGYFAPVVSVDYAGGGSGALFGNPVLTSSGDYAGAVSYYEQRRIFGGTPSKPQNIWMTKSGTESCMSYSLPVRDDDRIAFRVAAREANTIRHIVPLAQLILLTSSAEWKITSLNSDALTPTSISVQPQSYIGASNVQPAIVNNTLIYCAARGGHVREMAYAWQSSGFMTGDLSIRAAHLFDNFNIVDMCYSKAPQQIVWFVSTSGSLLGITYVPEQQIGAWHHHDTKNGTFESCTVVAEGDEDVLYVVVRRIINGSFVRYIERMASRNFVNKENAFFVDSGLTFDGRNTQITTVEVTGGVKWDSSETLTITSSEPIFSGNTDVGDKIVLIGESQIRIIIDTVESTTIATGRVDTSVPEIFRNRPILSWGWARNSISGLDHLEGSVVSILADGAVMSHRVVTNGTITLDQPALIVSTGLGIEADIKTLPIAVQIDNSFGQGRMKNVNKAWLRVFRSSGVWVGPDKDNLVEDKQRTTEPYGSPPALKSEETQVVLNPAWAAGGSVFVRQIDPLPLNIIGMPLEIAIGG